MGKMIVKVKPIIDESVRSLCTRPYPNHPKGCPNYGKKAGCPPSILLLDKIFALNEPVFAIYNIFDFGGHVQKMGERHPGWTQRQCECCLYWQGTARKQLRQEIQRFYKLHIGYPPVVTECPEAHGVNVTETMRSIGHVLQWPPATHAYQVALGGERI